MKTRFITATRCLLLLLLLSFFVSIQVASGFYDPSVQRWINRDPIAEKGGLNLYGFVHNGPLNYFDAVGLSIFDYIFNREIRCDPKYWNCVLKEEIIFESKKTTIKDVETGQPRTIDFPLKRKCVYSCTHKGLFSTEEKEITLRSGLGIGTERDPDPPCEKEKTISNTSYPVYSKTGTKG